MENDMICNFKKCRQTINKWAWVTSCSHIFCDEHGSKLFTKPFFCPACETSLPGKFDILRIDIQPSEQYKSMMLAGHRPETILDVSSRGIAFWTYQMHQELMYQKYVSTKAIERSTQIEQYHEQIISRTATELNTLKSQINSARKELEETRKKYNELTQNMSEKSRQYSKLQALYDNLRLRILNSSRMDSTGDGNHVPRLTRNQASAFHLNMPLTAEDIFGRLPNNEMRRGASPEAASHRETENFVFRPTSTPSFIPGNNVQHHRMNMQLGTPTAQAERPLEEQRPRI